MLDFLLLRDEDRPLWRDTGPDTLRYLVLDELHTYDGAQGTDVAMLLRRLGVTLGLAEPGRPLGLGGAGGNVGDARRHYRRGGPCATSQNACSGCRSTRTL